MSSEGSSSSIPKSPSSKTKYIHDIFVTNDFKFEYPWITFLKASLMNAGINTLVDSGQNISPTLLSSVQRSRIVVLVFTSEFRYYRDCVEKLEKIMECHENKVSLVLPIFFDVSPHEVREWWIREIAQGLETPISTRSLFLSVDGVSQNNIGRWRRLLLKITRRRARDDVNFSKCIRTVGFLEAEDQSAGWTVSSEDCDLSSESGKQIIREITNFIKRELEVSHLVLPPHLVGIQLRVKGVLNLFNYYSKDFGLMEDNVIMVGIWGIGGIGKTTLATAIYDTIKGSFESRSFLENIKNVWAKDNGPTCLQEQLISNISLTNSDKIHDIELGIRQIRTVLHNKRALIVLDNVSQMDQLMAFCGSGEGFGPGSMIIITTRNTHLLDDLKVKYVYEMKRMDQSESLEVFSWKAFKQSSPTNDLVKLAKRVVNCCEGLPLVLKVMGSFLSNRKIAEWQRVLKKLKSVPTGEIQEKLKISYEYLDDLVKDIFFNIACCYVGEEKEYVTEKLSGFQLPAETGISMLIERSLVEIKENNKLHMHDLLQEIVKGSIPNKPKPKYVYDVFLSFRGEDSRRSFTAHLYDALKKAGIEVFMDNEIQRGKNISSSLIQAIESSRLSIIIFSSNYGGSRWCLQELEKIMECHRTNVQEVLPIFYDVQPSDVRKQAGTFGKAMERLMMRISVGKDKELSWTRALNEAANLSGWDSHNYRNDVELIDHVVETISIKLDDSKCFLVANHPVGVKSRMQEIIKLLSGKSNEIILVGIFGMGGIGKTTIAKAIYNEIGQNFEGKSFLNNIREIWEQDNGQVCLQEHLLSSILKTRKMPLQSVEFGRTLLKDRLHHKRVFVVLDDVNNVEQLNALCGGRKWFGPGSRIIITTRDEHLLKTLQVDTVYNMKEMDDDESLELFSWHAFKQAEPIEGFVELSQRVITYSGGLPLALEILGSYLFDRTVKAWESVLDKLQAIPNDQIHKKLKISFDGLSDEMEKDIFLDICVFFIGKDRNYVKQILDGCGLHADIGITRLIERSLVKIDKKNKLEMHNLLRDMGREIIREESPKKPEKRSRLWFYNDVVNVLKNNLGTISVKGLAFNSSRANTPCFNTIAFCMMKRVTLLQLGHVKLDGNYEYLSKELRWLCWHGFPLSYMPDNFYQENVVAIDLRYSNLTQMWKKGQMMERLKILNLSHSYHLTNTPDFSKLPNLEKLVLKDCPRLSSIHRSIGNLKHLILVNLKDCKDLSYLPRSIYKLKSLKTLNISGCSNLDKLEENIVQMESLTILMANETAITQMPLSLVRSRSIKYVSLCGYEGLTREVFPALICSRMSPTCIPRSLIQPLASMPFLLPWLWHHGLYDQRRAKLETRPSTSKIPCTKSPALIGFHDQVHFTGVENLMSSLTIQVGEFNHVTDTLLKNISQGWSERGIGCSLPRNNNPDWLVFESEGCSLSFKVPDVTSCSLKGIIFCIIYSSPQDSRACIYPVGVTIRNFSKTTIDFYKRDAATTYDDKEWQNIIHNLEPGNDVEVTLAFAQRHTVNKTAIYMVYSEVDNKSRQKY